MFSHTCNSRLRKEVVRDVRSGEAANWEGVGYGRYLVYALEAMCCWGYMHAHRAGKYMQRDWHKKFSHNNEKKENVLPWRINGFYISIFFLKWNDRVCRPPRRPYLVVSPIDACVGVVEWYGLG